MSVGSPTAAGHGDHPNGHADESGVRMPSTRVGTPKEDLEGEQMRAPGGDVMDKAEQKGAREEIKEAQRGGESIGSGAGRRAENEGLGSV
ncbi:hypothetical protein B0O99DRAFT_695353 [Bisporella sp. PMI_857]|nr:hypothetical protein B0O99DRAFT_695353 [Bisporella sp. PMI_857]